LAKVFEGPYNNMGNWYKGITALAKERGFAFKELFAFYTTCPACAKAYGKNYVVLLARSA
ncbi:MAG: hydrolase, partial [Rectinemataceae bacterium]